MGDHVFSVRSLISLGLGFDEHSGEVFEIAARSIVAPAEYDRRFTNGGNRLDAVDIDGSRRVLVGFGGDSVLHFLLLPSGDQRHYSSQNFLAHFLAQLLRVASEALLDQRVNVLESGPLVSIYRFALFFSIRPRIR